MTSHPSADVSDARARLAELIRAKSFSDDREFTLASGRKSWVYFNMKPTMMDAEGAHLLAALLLRAVRGTGADLVGGMELGGVPLVSIVAAASFSDGGAPLAAFFVRKKAKDHGSQTRVEGLAPGAALRGRRIVMLEDVTTTGGSILSAVSEVRESGGRVDHVVTVVDRQEGAAAALEHEGLTLTALFTARDFTDKL